MRPCEHFCTGKQREEASTTVVPTKVASSSLSDAGRGAVSDQEFTSNNNAELDKKLMRKIDLWLVYFYSVVYIFRVIDSSNYANAAIINLENGTGIKAQLGFNANQWAWTQSIFSYSYTIFEPSNTLMLKVVSPSRWMFLLILFWGIAACSSAAVKDFPGMMVARFAIGAAEAGFYPSVLYHMAFWYKPSELPLRIAFFYAVGQVSSALSGLLAYAISFMDGLGGLPGWRWLFLLEGLPAILLAFVALFWLPDYPETAKFLTEEEREALRGRLSASAPKGKRGHWDVDSFKRLLKDPTFYSFSVYWICHGIGGFGVGYALPTVIYQLGFTTTANSQLMNIPPYIAAFVYLNFLGFLLHRKIIRPWTAAVGIESTIIVCYIILYTVSNPTVKYICLIVAVANAGSAYPVIWPERMRALDGTVAAGIGIGWTNAMAQFSGICGPHVFNTVFGPTYHTSYLICLSFLLVGITAILTSWWLVGRKDRRAAAIISS
ncbi:MFS general substrate transporter [Thozetella sp. PMI_491]|nr:MFS general substrate transporter [Thozetella sp. PMI_491]